MRGEFNNLIRWRKIQGTLYSEFGSIPILIVRKDFWILTASEVLLLRFFQGTISEVFSKAVAGRWFYKR